MQEGLLVGKFTIDSPSIDGNCRYSEQSLLGVPTLSPNVYVDGKPLETYDETSVPSPVVGIKLNPLVPIPCQPGVRKVLNISNTTVFINGKRPAISQDKVQLGSMSRDLQTPWISDRIRIGTNLIQGAYG